MTTAEELQKVPALFEHCMAAYEAMTEEAEIDQVPLPLSEEQNDDVPYVEVLVYEGFLTRLFKDTLHLSVPYYTNVMRRLKAMDCVRQLRRGGSTTPSRWALIKPPTLDDFMSEHVEQHAARPGSANQRIGDLNTRLRDLEEKMDAVLEYIQEEV